MRIIEDVPANIDIDLYRFLTSLKLAIEELQETIKSMEG